MKNINLKSLFNQYISKDIPKKDTNIFYQLIRGLTVTFDFLSNTLNIFKKERNILTAEEITSLRNLASQNGFEPILKEPAKGLIGIKVSPKLFNRIGFPIYLLPFAKFTNEDNGLTYYYESNQMLKIENDIVYVPVIEGQVVTETYTAKGEEIERIYLQTDFIANNSISIKVNNVEFEEVKSLYDNQNLNDNKIFVVKNSSVIETPIVMYVQGLSLNDLVTITYRVTSGELGNFSNIGSPFKTEYLINSTGQEINFTDSEITLQNVNGFDFGSNGTTINALKSAVGFNHGIDLLFDNISYNKFISKYSNIMIQDIVNDTENKQINNLFLFKKNSINPTLTGVALINEYRGIIDNKYYQLNDDNKNNLSSIISANEFALSSHNIYDGETNRFALQIKFDKLIDKEMYSEELSDLIYSKFSKFLYDKYYSLNIEILFDEFKNQKGISFDYTLFNEGIEQQKISTNNTELQTPIKIIHTDKLPILRGTFPICDFDGNPHQLFFDINFVVKN